MENIMVMAPVSADPCTAVCAHQSSMKIKALYDAQGNELVT